VHTRLLALLISLTLLSWVLVLYSLYQPGGAGAALSSGATQGLLGMAVLASLGLLLVVFSRPEPVVEVNPAMSPRRLEIASLQRLTQTIQRGKSALEIYQVLLEAAVETASADAAWLALAPGRPEGDTSDVADQHFQLTPEQLASLRQGLQRLNVQGVEFISNHLATNPHFVDTAMPFQSLMALPLQGPQHYYGTLYLLKEQPQGFDHGDLGILQTLASQTVLSIENLQLVTTSIQNQRTQEELKIASQVQDSLIPKNLPTDNWFEISSHSLAAKEVGGDFYDFLHLPGRRLAVLIGDVSGKGVTAAFHMAQMKGIFHALMQENPLAKSERDRFPVPSRFMVQANTALTHCLERSSFITSTLYIIDYEQGGFMFARAGHCHTLYYHAMREEVFYFDSAGLGLGIIRNDSYEKHIKNQFYDYSPGDVMVIYTDGIVEARGAEGAEYGEDRLKEQLEACYYLDAEEIKNHILTDLNGFTHGFPVHDDQTLLVIKFKSAQPVPLG
jgi:sigma-B regulation protein RsbU (phosphoserine phosphatase)